MYNVLYVYEGQNRQQTYSMYTKTKTKVRHTCYMLQFSTQKCGIYIINLQELDGSKRKMCGYVAREANCHY